MSPPRSRPIAEVRLHRRPSQLPIQCLESGKKLADKIHRLRGTSFAVIGVSSAISGRQFWDIKRHVAVSSAADTRLWSFPAIASRSWRFRGNVECRGSRCGHSSLRRSRICRQARVQSATVPLASSFALRSRCHWFDADVLEDFTYVQILG